LSTKTGHKPNITAEIITTEHIKIAVLTPIKVRPKRTRPISIIIKNIVMIKIGLLYVFLAGEVTASRI